MGCNCKKDKNGVEIKDTSTKKNKKPLVIKGISLISKIILFLFGSIIATLIVIPFSIYMLYKVIFIDGNMDFTDNLLSFGKMLKKKDKDDDDDDEEEFEFEDEDEIVLLNAE